MASATKGVWELWELGGKCRTSSVKNVLNYPEYALPFGVCVGRFSRPCEDWYDNLSCEDILVWRDFFVAKCNLWIHYTTHTFWVTAGCLIIVQALVATLGYKKKLGPDPFHNKYMCSCCCCCCSTTRLAGEMLFFQGAARNILNLSAQSTRNHLFFFSWTGQTLLLLNAGGQRNEHIYVNTPFLKVKGVLCSFGETVFLYD